MKPAPLHPSSFILHPFIILHPSSFILHPSSFILSPPISERHTQTPRRRHHLPIRVHALRIGDGVADRNRDDALRAERDHVAELAERGEIRRGLAETRRQNAIERDGRAAPLRVS